MENKQFSSFNHKYLDGVAKVKKIMRNTTVFVCRTCGLSHGTFIKAQECCKKANRPYNKNRELFNTRYLIESGKGE